MDCEINNIINKDTQSIENETNANNSEKHSCTENIKTKKNHSKLLKVKKSSQENQKIQQTQITNEPQKEIPVQDRPEFNLLSSDQSEKIHFYNSTLTEQDCLLISENLKQNKSCNLLSLGNSKVTDSGLAHICEALKTNFSLQTIGLGNNLISDKGLFYLGEALKGHKSLRTIGLGNNSIGDSGIEFLCEGLKKNEVFQDLLLYNNKLTFKSCECLRDLLLWETEKAKENGITGNKQIKKLYLASNQIKSEGVLLLAQALQKNQTLQYLGLSHCGVNDAGIFGFATSLELNEKCALKFLSLGNNEITSEAVKPLFAALAASAKEIEEVSLEWNLLDDSCVEDVIDFLLKSKKSLRKLLLNNNKLSDSGVLEIAEFVVKFFNFDKDNNQESLGLHIFEFVGLSGNNVSETVKGEISKMLLENKCGKVKIK